MHSDAGNRAVQLDASESWLVDRAAQRAARNFAWYARCLSPRESPGDDARPSVPVLYEADLATTYYTAERVFRGAGKAYATSGTSGGVPKRVWWPAGDHRRYVEHRARLFADFVGRSCVTACADLGTGHAADSALEIFARAGLRGTQIDVALPVDRHVALLRRDQPDLIYTMPMMLERIVASGGPGYVPRRIVVVGDLAPREWRRAMAERIGIDSRAILDVFGSIEVGAIAYSDDELGGYLFHEHIIPEIIPSDSAPAGGGLLALTSLERDGFPVVRYVAGDVVAGLRRFDSADGPRWGYDAHLGRIGSELKHGEMLSLHAVAVALAQAAPGVAWAAERNGLEVVIALDRHAFSPAIADSVRVAIRAAHPSVDRLIRSGLVGDIAIVPFAAAGFKRRLPRPAP